MIQERETGRFASIDVIDFERSLRRTRKERRWRGTEPAAEQAFSTTAITRTWNKNLDQAALQGRITDTTYSFPDHSGLVQALTVPNPKGIEGEVTPQLATRIS
ncbi:hypothetical protein KEM48_013116 [Puccinia striiformis f. sp. tritici PST-130]|nr:hypothetical protein KEM48_013116 [Puccinia striiformis f. sp. tritici PST-130]